MAVDARCRDRRVEPGAFGRRSIHLGIGQPRRTAHRRDRCEPQREPVARAAARPARRGTRCGTLRAARCQQAWRWRRASERRRCSICRPAGPATDSGRSGMEGLRRFGGAWMGRCPSRPPCRRTDSGWLVVVRREGKRHLSIMSADGTGQRTLAPSVEIEGAAGQGAADWSPDGTKIVTGGRDAKGPALFIIPVDTGVPVRLVEGTWVNPVWSPKGDLIVYAGRSVIGQVELRGVRPDGSSCRSAASDGPAWRLPLSARRIGPGLSASHPVARFLAARFRDEEKRVQLTRLDNQGALRTFDITPDGKSIVFDRSRQNSNIVLFDLPKQ